MAKTQLTNRQVIEAIVSKYPTIGSHSSKETLKLLTEAGFEEIKSFQPELLSDFFGLLVRTWLQQVNISHAKDPLEENGFGEYYDTPYGGYVQRMSVNSVKPLSPAYKGLKNGDAPDPFVVYKPEVGQRFFKQNFDYQSLITMPDEFALKQVFLDNYGIDQLMGGVMEGLRNGYVIQKYTNKLEAINAALSSTEYPLKDTQYVTLTMNAPEDESTEADLKNLILNIKNVIEAMVSAPQTGAFNQAGFESTQDKSRLKLLVRYGFSTAISVFVLSSAFNAEQLNLGIDLVPVPNFGGLVPYKEAGFTTKLYPAYDDLGHVIGYAESEGQSEATVTTDKVFWKDPHEDVIAVLADKGLVFESVQNPYRVEPIRNPRGLYTNYWASSPNNGIAYDRYYNMVVFQKTASEAA